MSREQNVDPPQPGDEPELQQLLDTSRPDEAKYWRLLTDLTPDHLSFQSF